MPDVIFTIQVDDTDVMRILRSVERSVDTPSLSDFLEDSVHEWWKVREFEVFAHEGDIGTGTGMMGGWEELSPATQNIREYLGYDGDSPINIRSGQMLHELLNSYDLGYVPGGASITIPGRGINPLTEEKIRTAQEGKISQTPTGDQTVTPPRPVLNLNEADAAAVLTLLNLHIYKSIAGDLL